MRRRRGGLSPEDRDLWTRYARTARPLEPARRAASAPAPAAPQASPAAPAPEAPTPVPPFEIGARARARASTWGDARPAAPAAALRMDAKARY